MVGQVFIFPKLQSQDIGCHTIMKQRPGEGWETTERTAGRKTGAGQARSCCLWLPGLPQPFWHQLPAFPPVQSASSPGKGICLQAEPSQHPEVTCRTVKEKCPRPADGPARRASCQPRRSRLQRGFRFPCLPPSLSPCLPQQRRLSNPLPSQTHSPSVPAKYTPRKQKNRARYSRRRRIPTHAVPFSRFETMRG